MAARALVAMSVATLLLLGVCALLVRQEFQIDAAIADGWAARDRAHELARELRQSSDDLTRMARTYAVTGDERYRQYFQEILDIRKGAAPRPENYRLAYWDLITAGVSEDARPAAGSAVALRTLMQSAGFTDAELALLAESEDQSNALTQLEAEAFAAVRNGDLQGAQALLHSDAYHQAKAQIMLPIRRFVQAMDGRTADQIAQLAQRQQNLNRYLLAAAALLLALVLATLVVAAFGMAAKRNFPAA